ncbi:6-phospho-3-hexuloisomerase [Spirillospora sp. NPDC029432]|uniref:6-phospho-3-hexuloisomerase n=1 Tax=Spirillospora sp. NPDC029432 TaxID=3154599 RepID=UPI0034515C2C
MIVQGGGGMDREEAKTIFEDSLGQVLTETGSALRRTDGDDAVRFIERLRAAGTVYVAGAGRSGLAVQSFAMRLMHLGLPTHVAGDVTTPSIGPGDLMVTCSGSGSKRTVLALARTAKENDAALAVVTADSGSPLARLADLVLLLPEGEDGYNSADTEQFMGTLFEQMSYLFFDSVVLTIQRLIDIDQAEMEERHTNLE